MVTTEQRHRTPALPPGPALPTAVQTMGFAVARHVMLPLLHKRFGDVFSLRLPGRPTVILADLDDIRTVFTGAPSVFHAGEGNEILGSVMGEHSVLLLDEDAHTRARKLLMPAFSTAALRGYRGMVSEIAETQASSWRAGRMPTNDRMRSITLEVILRVVFGMSDPARLRRMRPLVTKIATAGFITMFGGMYPDQLGNLPPWRGYRRTIEELDVLLYQEIRERRACLDEERTDVLSRLLRAGSGELSDVELRDELVTLLLAGHETTSTALSWTLLELARNQAVLRAATEAADGEGKEADDYLEACVKEAMRLHPVISQVARRLTEPARIGEHLLPAGTVVAPSILLVQRSTAHHASADRYVPQRFLDGSVTTGNWFPFGGGVRRCIGAGFSLMESVAILRAVLRHHELRAPAGRPEGTRTRNITLVPARGATVLLSPRATRPVR